MMKSTILVLLVLSIGSLIGCVDERLPDNTDQPPVEATEPEYTTIAYVSREVRPSEADETIKRWNEPHYVCVPALHEQHTGKLWVFLPGTGATPDYYTVLTETVAQSGLHAISLRYPNDESVNIQICPGDTDPDCHGKVRQEIVTGASVSDHVVVDEANSIQGRVKSLLRYLSEHYGDESWGEYLNAEGEVIWSSVIVAGHSQGAGHAVYLAYENKVHRVVAFAWVDVRRGAIAPWLREKSSQTPPEGYYLFFHQDDVQITKHLDALITVLGIEQFGAPVIVDGNLPPYQGSHALIATVPPPEGEIAHNTHVLDRALKHDEYDVPIYDDVWRYLVSLEHGSVLAEKAVRIGSTEVSYIDPEFHSAENLVAYADQNRQAWLAHIDPTTGDFVSLHGRDVLLDQNLTPLRVSFNGPEFGIDSEGWAMYYTKDVSGVPQIWKAAVSKAEVECVPVTIDSLPRLSVLASKSVSANTTRLLYSQGAFALGDGVLAWREADSQDHIEVLVDLIDTGARWIDDTLAFTFIRESGPDSGQVAIYDTETLSATTITDTTDELSYAYGWIAPEYDELLVLVVVNHIRIEIYRNTGGRYWDCISTLSIPEQSLYGIIGSPEPFTAAGNSYISLVIKETQGYAPAEVWVWGIEEGSGRVALKCNDGQGSIIRSDPESYIGQNEVYIYYNLIRQGALGRQIFELYKWNPGIPTS